MSKRDTEGFEHAIYAAPYEGGRLPISVRTGRMAAQAVVEAEFGLSRDGIVTQGHAPSGMWDFELEAKMRAAAGCRILRAPPRKHEEQMREYADARSHELSDREQEVFMLFWVGKLSYGQIGRQLGITKKRVENYTLEIKAKARKAGYLPED